MQLDFILGAEQLHAIQFGSVVVPDHPALFWIEGPGALDCLQGLLTSDLSAVPENSVSYGAMLTAKGMIILDPFVVRRNDGFLVVLPGFTHERAMAHFRRTLPPRLARLEDRTESWGFAWLLGRRSIQCTRDLEGFVPGTATMPFKGFIAGEPARLESAMQILEQKGARAGDEGDLAAARVLAGWPSLGREIDEKTLPQEVRYDELGAVSYSKGCYTGQETVARVHFRGHPNRVLRAVAFPAADIPADRTITMQGKEVGVLRTTVRTDDRTIALATLRREVPEAANLQINEVGAQIIALPVVEGVTA